MGDLAAEVKVFSAMVRTREIGVSAANRGAERGARQMPS